MNSIAKQAQYDFKKYFALEQELKRQDLDKFWNPLLYIENILSETKEATWLTATCNTRGEAFVLERRRIRGLFMENLELNDFPLDCQVIRKA